MVALEDVFANISSEHYFTAAEGIRYNWLTDRHPGANTRKHVKDIADALPERSVISTNADIDRWLNPPKELKRIIFCAMVLRNGFTVIGEARCSGTDLHCIENGKAVSRQRAIEKTIALMDDYERYSKLSGKN